MPVDTLYDLRPEDIIVTRKYSPEVECRGPSVESNDYKRVVKVVRGSETSAGTGNDFDADFDELEREQKKVVENIAPVHTEDKNVASVHVIASLQHPCHGTVVETIEKVAELKEIGLRKSEKFRRTLHR